MIYLGSLDSNDYVAVRTISAELNISATFLAKILKNLLAHDLVDTHRGPTGGVRLARAASTITVRQVVEAVDGDALFKACVLGLPNCGNDAPCPMHQEWAQTRQQIQKTFDSSTISSLGDSYASGGIRLKGE
ncbi:MAG: Rrf2 family transcriptional regulator [Rhodothermales bacterium]|nr:Rrf2 family transcriptional regulator [Rhodothermales bacterium]